MNGLVGNLSSDSPQPSAGEASDRPKPEARRWLGGWAFHDLMALSYFLIIFVLAWLSPQGAGRNTCFQHIVLTAGLVIGACVLGRVATSIPRRIRAQIYRLAWFCVVIESYLMLRDVLPQVRSDSVDDTLLAMDMALLGFEPALWLERFNQRPIIEWFSFFYFSYFWLNAVYLCTLLWVVKPGRHTTEYAIGSLMVMYVGQLGYMAVPGYGPIRYLDHLYSGPLDGGLFWGLVWSTVEAAGAVKDIFPSLHTAIPTWMSLFAITQARRDRRWRWVAILTSFFTANIVVSTMLLRWHYVVDVIAGLVLAASAAYLAPRIARREAAWRSRHGFPMPWEM